MAERDLVVKIIGDARSLEKTFASVTRSSQRFNRSIGGVSVRAFAGLTAGAVSVRKVSQAITGAVTAASDLSEEINKTNVVFGQSAAAIQRWSRRTASSLGIARKDALAAAAGFGNILQTSGLTEQTAAQFSRRLVQLAADMASFNNIDPSLALEKLRAGLVGEAEPLRTVGVLLSEARVKTEAYASGIAAQGSKLTEAQKVQARYNLILQDTAKQQGDFARTSGGLANTLRRIRGQTSDWAATLGAALLPIITRVSNQIADWLSNTENQQRVQRTVNDALDKAVQVVRGLSTVIGTLRQALRPVVSLMGGLENSVRVLATVLVARKVALYARAITGLGTEAAGATTKVRLLRTSLLRIGRLGAITLGVNLLVNVIDKETRRSIVDDLKSGRLGSALLKATIGTDFGLGNIGQKPEYKSAEAKAKAASLQAARKTARSILEGIGRQFQTESFRVGIRPVRFKIPQFVPGTTGSAAGVTSLATSAAAGLTRGGVERIERLNDFFDSRISRALDRVQDVKSLQGQLAALGRVASLITARLAKTKDITRRLTLEDKLLDVQRAAAGVREQIQAEFFEGLELKVDLAAATGNVKREVAALKNLEAAIKDRIRVEGRTIDLQRSLLNVRQRIQDAKRAAKEAAAARRQELLDRARDAKQRALDLRQARQFRALGFASTGDAIVPQVANLRKQLSSVTGAVEGTFLDTDKTRSMLARIRKVLSGGLGQLSRDVRARVKEMLDGIRDELRNNDFAKQTKARGFNAKTLLAGLGLDPDEVRRITARLSGFNTAGKALATRGRTVGAFGQPISLAGTPVVVSPPAVYLDGQKVSAVTRRHDQAFDRRNPTQKRGGR